MAVEILNGRINGNNIRTNLTAQSVASKFYIGEKGDKGNAGEDGATFTPSVGSNGYLSWSNNKGLPNPATMNIKGEKGDKGDAGISITITGYVSSSSSLPEEGLEGDIYAVVTGENKELYAWVTSPTSQWISIGYLQVGVVVTRVDESIVISRITSNEE